MARSINFAYEVVSFLSLAGTTQTNKLQMSRFILNLWTRFSLFPRFPRTLKALAQYFPLCSLKIYVLKKFVPSSLPPPRTHFDFITTKLMPSGKALPRWDEIVLPEQIRTRQWVRPFFGLRNWGHFAWPIRACFFLQIELAFKSRIIVEALTSECNIKLVPTLRTLKKKLPKKAGTTNWKCRLFRWPLQERRVV